MHHLYIPQVEQLLDEHELQEDEEPSSSSPFFTRIILLMHFFIFLLPQEGHRTSPVSKELKKIENSLLQFLHLYS